MSDILLYHGDCLDEMDKIPDGSVDLVLTDPPYGTTACKWDSVIPFEPMWAQLKRVAKKNAAIVLFGSEPFSSALRMSNLQGYRYDWIWAKSAGSGFLNASKMPMKKHENISVFYKKLPNYNPQNLVERKKTIKTRKAFTNNTALGSIGVKNVGEEYLSEHENYPIAIQFCKEEKGLHPTQKPVALLEYLIRTYTNEGETVLDFTMGSGSTGVACINTNRRFIGIELDADYFSIAQERIRKATEQVSMAELERIVIT